LATRIKLLLQNDVIEFSGFSVLRSIVFLGKKIRFGGVSRLPTVRIFRVGFGEIEQRWMDEHILVDGKIGQLDAELLDINLKSLTWWIDKHNHYSSREAVDILDLRYRSPEQTVSIDRSSGFLPSLKRALKERLFLSLPVEISALLYFVFRYIFLLGFLDGSEGFAFHFLQGFWYRYIAGLKARQVVTRMKLSNLDYAEAVWECLRIRQIDQQ
jgi:hypothetical protein